MDACIRRSAWVLLSIAVACGGGGSKLQATAGGITNGSSSTTGSDNSSAASSAASSTAPSAPRPTGACAVANALRGGSSCHFLVGMGNDLATNHDQDGAYTLGTTVDLHYAYMVGLPTKGGWPDWNTNGSFVNIMTDEADKNGVTPMFTLYAMAYEGDGNLAMTTDDAAMNLYWQGAKLLFQRIAIFGKPAVVHLEPDFWAYAMKQTVDGTMKVIVSAHAPDCAGLPDNLIGMAGCLLKLARTYAPLAYVGFHASAWGGAEPDVISFFKAIHADQADFVVTDILDRDAGCYEAATDPNCMRGGGSFYWDETNQTSPNFHDHLSWVTALHQGLNLPVLWWQLPFGVPSTTPGGTSGHYRDNRVHYVFQHIDEFVAAGGLGVTFGTGASNQTDITTDGDEFKNAVAGYFAKPTLLQ
jgi:hypothetical protein